MQEDSSKKSNSIVAPGLGQRLTELFPHISNVALGELLGVVKSSITNYKKEDRIPKWEVLFKIRELHPGLSIHWLIFGEGTKFINSGQVVQLVEKRLQRTEMNLLLEEMSEAELTGLLAIAEREQRTPIQMIAVLIRRELQQTHFQDDEGAALAPMIGTVSELMKALEKLPEQEKRAASAQVIGELVLRATSK